MSGIPRYTLRRRRRNWMRRSLSRLRWRAWLTPRTRLWQTVNRLLHRKSSSPLPSSTSVTSLADSFASFFIDKISRLRISLTSISPAVSPHTPSPPSTPPVFPTFRPASESEIYKIVFDCTNKQSDWEQIPTWLLKKMCFCIHPYNYQHCQSLSQFRYFPSYY